MEEANPTVAWVSRWLLAQLDGEPESHMVLAHLVCAEAFIGSLHEIQWTYKTGARRLREAVAYLQRQGHPVISTREGIKLATGNEMHLYRLKLEERAGRLRIRSREMARGPKFDQPTLPGVTDV